MNKKTIVISVIGLAALGAGGYGLWWLGMSQGMAMMSAPMSGAEHAHSDDAAGDSMAKSDPSTWNIPQGEAATRRHMEQGIKAGDIDPETGLKVLYYHDPMVPGRNFDSPGKSPFMDMMLVPEYAGSAAADESTVQISPRVEQNLGMRTVVVQRSSIAPQVVADGTVGWNERDRSVIQARATGFVERLRVTATLDRVKKGQPLMTLYVPDWVAVQQEFLSLLNMKGSNLDPLVQAAKQRMLQVGMTADQIRSVEKSRTLQTRVPVVAPRDGVVTELMAREGMTVSPGMTLLEINGLDPVWVEAEVPESQVEFVQSGTPVKASSRAFPGQSFEGRVQTVLPQVNVNTRTVRARLALDNPEGRLLPGMFVNVRLQGQSIENRLTVPSQSVIYTGTRAVVMVAKGEGRFTPTEIKTGQEAQGQVEVLAGLKEGQQVAVSGQFLLDSEATLKGLEARLLDEPGVYRTTVVVEDTDEPTFPMMTHPPIEELNWPEMTMQFELSEQAQSQRSIKPGDQFGIEFKMQEGGVPMITRVLPADQVKQGGQP
ncbi:MAG: efflux RND transporter periplasmic adaptor subunit [Limnobacter sp.]|nr:efflux RND transporter periplasmic adaptor subunit [Limnobacter sp.]